MTNQDIYDQFEYEDCSECGQDTNGHMVGIDIFGNEHAICKEDAY